MAGQDTAYDGPFYAERSPINVIDKVNVPTFLIAGEYDLFQRGTPLLFERLRQRGIPTRLIIGPWDHLKGSSGRGGRQRRLRHRSTSFSCAGSTTTSRARPTRRSAGDIAPLT